MAEIFAFPQDAGAARHGGGDAVRPGRPHGVPDAVWQAVESVRAMTREPGMRYREIPVPSSMADYGIGVRLDGDGAGPRAGEGAGGWIMMLYMRHGAGRRPGWRCVAFAKVPLDAGEHDALASDLYWQEARERIERVGDADSIAGTVTVFRNTSFGLPAAALAAGCELRVSWTPLATTDDAMDAGAQTQMWARFLRSVMTAEEEPSVDR